MRIIHAPKATDDDMEAPAGICLQRARRSRLCTFGPLNGVDACAAQWAVLNA